MKAVAIEKFGGPETLELIQIEKPNLNPNEVEIQVKYAGVNPVDWKIREGLKTTLKTEFPLVLGWDAAGVITAVGDEVKNFKVGDEVYTYCRQPILKWGTYAEYVNVEENIVCLKPKNINFAQAASVPLVALTAWQSLFDNAHLKKGQTILIHAGAGGVGSLAIQFAKNAGAKVYTTASGKHLSYLKSIGADFVIDYKNNDFVKELKKFEPEGVDVVFDTLGGKTLKESLNVLKPHGKVVSLLEKVPDDVSKRYNVESFYVFVTPNGKQLNDLKELFEKRLVVAPKIKEMPLELAASAQEILKNGQSEGGKIVLKIGI